MINENLPLNMNLFRQQRMYKWRGQMWRGPRCMQ